MDRRTFLKSSVGFAAGLAACSNKTGSGRRPNILIFFTDDQRASTIGALGNEHIHTPNIDRLVKRGTAFTRAYMMGGMLGATCIPSRAMLHTGRHLFNLTNGGRGFGPDDITIAEHLRHAGYFTYFTGKRHSLTREKLKAGFEDGGVVMGFAGYLTDKRRMPMHDWDPSGEYKPEDGYVVSGAPGNPRVKVPKRNDRKAIEAIPPGPFSAALYVEPAIEKIRSMKGDKPWFMYVALSAPHDPHEAPDEFRRMYAPDKIPLPENFLPEHPFDNGEMNVRDELLTSRPRDPKEIRQRIADYYASISHIDFLFGRMVQAIEGRGQLENTIILFAGDSGLAIGQHGLLGKQNLYDDAGVHIPMIWAGPGIPNNQRRDALVLTIDVFPTLCDLAGVPIPDSVDGTSLVEVMENPKAETRDSIYLGYREFQRAVVEKRFKLIEYVGVTMEREGQPEKVGSRHTQLFDLESDPWETENLADDPAYAAELKRLRMKLIALRDRYNDGTESCENNHPEMYEQYKRFWDNYV